MLRPFVAVLAVAALCGFGSVPAEAQNAGRNPRTPAQDDNPVPQAAREKQFPLGAAWSAISINGKPVGGERPTLVVDEQLRAKGFAGCNTFSATAFPLREQGFVVGPVAVTRKTCEGGANANERAFLVALRGSRKWDLEGGRLVLQGAAGELRFERAL
jgi:heat shock protein HslJ